LSVGEHWVSLESAQVPDGRGYVKRRLRPDLAMDVFVAVARPSGRRCLLLKADGVDLRALPRFSGSRGIESRLVTDAGEGRFLEVSLRDRAFADIFDKLLDDVVLTLPPDTGPGVAARVVARLILWQKFLSATPSPLGEEAQRGLYGELWFLKEHVFRLRGLPGVGGWVGPTRAAQDFQFSAMAIEVKTSVADQDQALRIVSERQLDDVGIARLFLFHLSVDMRAGETGSLPDLVASVRREIADNPWRDEFEGRLAEAGYSDADRERYVQPCYAIREQNLFRVAAGFPRLTESVLQAGVGDVHYSIRLSACKPFAVDMSELK
jgi:hypothetical protein